MIVNNVVLYSLFCVIFFLITLSSIVQILYILQLNSYNLKSIYDDMLCVLRKHIVYWILYIVICIGFYVLRIKEFWLLLLAEILIGVIIFILGNWFRSARKIKYTKRMIRLIIVSILIIITSCLLCVYGIQIRHCVILLPFVLLYNYLIVSLAYLILMPIEYLIGEYYVTKARGKLNKNKKLVKVGITGSFGKTSTKEILTTILKEGFNVLSTPKSYNTPFGVTKTINEGLDNLHEVFVCEMGAKKRGEIKYLCELINVGCGIVTSVGRQHTSTFGSIENVYRTKNELPNALYNKLCVFNLMNRYTIQMYKEFIGEKIGVFIIPKRTIGFRSVLLKKMIFVRKGVIVASNILSEYPKKNNYYAKNVKCNENGSNFDIYYNDNFVMSVSVVLIGIHNIINILLAVALAFRLGMNKDNVSIGLSKVRQIKARLEKFELSNGAIVLNNGYNSNIDSAKYAVGVLNFFNKEHKVIVTPGLIETDDDYEYNVKFGQLISKYCTEVVIVKEKNKGAILKGLINGGFDMCNVVSVSEFKDAMKIMNNANSDYVFLIENDLPDNYK